MLATTHGTEIDITVECPETHTPWRITVIEEDDGRVQVLRCSRFWGELLCDAPCRADAADAFNALRATTPHEATRVYCGQPNLAAPRPREGSETD